MSGIPGWQEVQSQVYRPRRWPALKVGTLFLLVGGIGFLTIGGVVPAGFPLWCAKLGTAVFALLGGLVVAWAIGSIISPVHVHHAAPDVLPDVPKEPVIREGSVVYGRLTHELVEDAHGWQFQPAGHNRHNDKAFLLGFGIPFLALFAGLLTWVVHNQIELGWLVSAVCGVLATFLCGGSAFVLIGLNRRAGYRHLARLTIPSNTYELESDSPLEPDFEKADLIEGLKWALVGPTVRRRLTIPRDLVVAIQLCPWKFVSAGDITWAVQGLLVLASSETAVYHRLPVLLTSDFVGAARLMQKLALALRVPYLFCADAENWKAEKLRAKKRPSLRFGGTQT